MRFISNSLLDVLRDLGSVHHLSAAFSSVRNAAGLGVARHAERPTRGSPGRVTPCSKAEVQLTNSYSVCLIQPQM